MKNDVSRRYYARIVMNIVYSAIITCLVEIFLVANISMIARYLTERGQQGRFLEAVLNSQSLVVLIYVLFGICLFSRNPAVSSGALHPLYGAHFPGHPGFV